MENLEENISKNLLKIEAVFLKPDDPFTWASGIKSPIYCDNRLTLSEPKVRDEVEKGLAQIIKENYRRGRSFNGNKYSRNCPCCNNS